MGSLLDVRNLSIEYKLQGSKPFRAVDEVCFDIEPGETVGLMGESGCGKSSTALALLGLLPRESVKVSGSAALCGHELLGMTEKEWQKLRASKISLIFQEPEMALHPMIRGGEQIAEVIHAHRAWNWKECRRHAMAILERMRLEPVSRIFAAYPHQLSGGQRQRIVLAQAISCNPEILIADEPTASLDARSQADFLVLLSDLKKETGLSILLISHSPELQAKLADRLLVMKEGRILEQGSPERLFENPTHDYTRRMFRQRTSLRESRAMPGNKELEEQLTR